MGWFKSQDAALWHNSQAAWPSRPIQEPIFRLALRIRWSLPNALRSCVGCSPLEKLLFVLPWHLCWTSRCSCSLYAQAACSPELSTEWTSCRKRYANLSTALWGEAQYRVRKPPNLLLFHMARLGQMKLPRGTHFYTFQHAVYCLLTHFSSQLYFEWRSNLPHLKRQIRLGHKVFTDSAGQFCVNLRMGMNIEVCRFSSYQCHAHTNKR